MRRIPLRIILLILLFVNLFGWTFKFYIIADRETELTIGMNENATLSYDRGLDIPAPPLPPEGSHTLIEFDDPDMPYLDGLWKDYRPITDKAIWNVKTHNIEQPLKFHFIYNDLPSGQFTINDSIDIREYTNGLIELGMARTFTIRYSENYQPLPITSGNRLPDRTGLENIYPNPFNQHTSFYLTIAENNLDMNLSLYNILGKKIKDIWKGTLKKGTYRIIYDGTNKNNEPLASGLYLCKLQSGDRVIDINKLLVVR